MSKFLDRMSEFLAHRKGLLPIIGLILILINLLIQFIIPGSFLATLARRRIPPAAWGCHPGGE